MALFEALTVIDHNVDKMLNMDLGDNAINDVILPVFAIFHQMRHKPAIFDLMRDYIMSKIGVHLDRVARQLSEIDDKESLQFGVVYAEEWRRFRLSSVCLQNSFPKLSQNITNRQLHLFFSDTWSGKVIAPLSFRIRSAITNLLNVPRKACMEITRLKLMIESLRTTDSIFELSSLGLSFET